MSTRNMTTSRGRIIFSLKDEEHGIGLGLAISDGIIKNYGGNLEFKNKVGKDTTFIVRLPV